MWHIGDVVRKLREEKGLSRFQLAAKAGVNKSTVSLFEKNPESAEQETIKKLAHALGSSVATLHVLVPLSGHSDPLRHTDTLRSVSNIGPHEAQSPESGAVQAAAVDEVGYERAIAAIERIEALTPLVRRLEELARTCERILLADQIQSGAIADANQEAARRRAARRRGRKPRRRKAS